MTNRHRCRTAAFPIIACAALPTAQAALSLQAADAPVDTPWTQPASLSLVREGGANTVAADLALNYRSELRRRSNRRFAAQGSYSAGIYLHRDATAAVPKNDRGVAFSYAGLLVPDFDNAGSVGSVGYLLKASIGKSLTEIEQANGIKSQVDKTRTRLVASLGGYLQPRLGGEPRQGRIPPVVFVDGGPGLYLDQASGSGISGSGREVGAMLKLGLNYAPLGLEPQTVAGLAMIPTLRVAAQVQKDFSATESRTKKTRTLYSIGLNLLFARPEEDIQKLIPSLQLSRSVGADLLTGRAESAKTELTFGLTF